MEHDEGGQPLKAPNRRAGGGYVETTSDAGPLVALWRLPMKFANEPENESRWEKAVMPALLAAIELMTDPMNGQEDGWARGKIVYGMWTDLWGSSGSGFAAEASILQHYVWVNEPWWHEGVEDVDEEEIDEIRKALRLWDDVIDDNSN